MTATRRRRRRGRPGTAAPCARSRSSRQHEVGDLLPAGRPADAGPDPVEVAGAERGAHRPQPVVAVVAAAELDPQRAERDVELVVDGDDPLGRDLVERGQRLDRAAGLVHVAARPREHDARPGRARRAQPALDDVGAAGLVGAERRRPSGRPARRRRGSRRCAGGRRRPGRDCPARPRATRRRVRSRSWLEVSRPVATAQPVGGPRRRSPSAASPSAPSAASASSPSAISSSDSSRSMPASASASSSSASSSSSVGAWVTLTISVSSSVSSVRAVGQVEVGGEDLGADLGALDGDLDVLGDVGGLGLERDGGVLGDDQGLRGGLADEVDRDVDGDLLALA